MRHTIVEFIAHETSFLYEQGFKPKSKRESKYFIKHISENMHYFIEIRTSFGISIELCFGVKMKNLNALLSDLNTPLLKDSFWLRTGFEELLNPKSIDELGDDFRQFYFDAIAPFFEANNHLSGMFQTLRKVEGLPMGGDENHTLGDTGIWLDLLLTRFYNPEELEERANFYKNELIKGIEEYIRIGHPDIDKSRINEVEQEYQQFLNKMQNLDVAKTKLDLGIEGDNEA